MPSKASTSLFDEYGFPELAIVQSLFLSLGVKHMSFRWLIIFWVSEFENKY